MFKTILNERAIRHSAFYNKETVLMTVDEYDELVLDSIKLIALEAEGVRYWNFYDRAMEIAKNGYKK